MVKNCTCKPRTAYHTELGLSVHFRLLCVCGEPSQPNLFFRIVLISLPFISIKYHIIHITMTLIKTLYTLRIRPRGLWDPLGYSEWPVVYVPNQNVVFSKLCTKSTFCFGYIEQRGRDPFESTAVIPVRFASGQSHVTCSSLHRGFSSVDSPGPPAEGINLDLSFASWTQMRWDVGCWCLL